MTCSNIGVDKLMLSPTRSQYVQNTPNQCMKLNNTATWSHGHVRKGQPVNAIHVPS
jgi:hypothetical protein